MFTKSFEISIHALREEGDPPRFLSLLLFFDFYPRPPRGGRHMVKHNVPNCAWKDFYPRPPRGGRHIANGVLKAFKRFLSTPSARRATRGRDPGIQLPAISIHALREEGDSSVRISSTSPSDFYPRPPRGGRPRARGSTTTLINFYPRPPRGGRPKISPNRTSPRKFLSTPSARRATYRDAKSEPSMDISIHALREEGDCTAFSTNSSSRLFLSTPSARRATLRKGLGVQHQRISIHALREEGDGLRRTF